jgi:hypothetical protein
MFGDGRTSLSLVFSSYSTRDREEGCNLNRWAVDCQRLAFPLRLCREYVLIPF